MRVALATCASLPEPDPDQQPLLDALCRAGVDATLHAWDADEGVNADLIVLRSTWNYYRRIDDFLGWVERTAVQHRMLNPPDIVRANAHKRYLLDLPARGVPSVETVMVPQGEAPMVAMILDAHGWSRAVVKPAVSAASYRTMLVSRSDVRVADAHLATITADADALVQPYVADVEIGGERSVVWIDGEISHAVRKQPRLGAAPERVSECVSIDADERALTQKALAPWKDRLLYARVDMVRDESGRPMVMEVELIEPSLFLVKHPPALQRFAEAIVRRAGGW